MSYQDFTPTSREGKIGKAIYLNALDDRRGFRYDQLGIGDDDIWTEIFEHIPRRSPSRPGRRRPHERQCDRRRHGRDHDLDHRDDCQARRSRVRPQGLI